MQEVQPLPSVPADDPPPRKPEAPLPSECCESGCDPCVYDTYADELEWYRKALAAWRERHPGAVGQEP
ncbi:oxidoreductase-like domain-containing protein [Lysobacter sp. GX 14042]|uniref:oxidoreductase-like domain-containing protein n=1 Tax=Lysobacter sp. GX 14042 TaxID=2907155 RepID=UPI001F3E81E2|nr:oxidoreductase-like domain-containing protein [Lysobacter sp. GX 14042]MCE7031210.1 oxidoreductase-like domain-containing protein [Lysobacter sp. GX 14042]